MKLYHVTAREDCGEGIYFWDDFYWALDFAQRGGWDGEIEDPVILTVETESASPCAVVLGGLPPEWEAEREKYEHTWMIQAPVGTAVNLPVLTATEVPL